MHSRFLLPSLFSLLCCYVCVDQLDGAKILALPLAIQNHVTEMNAVGSVLARRGYEVVFFLPRDFDAGQLKPRRRVIRYGQKTAEKINSVFSRAANRLQGDRTDTFTRMSDLRRVVCSHIDKDVDAMEKLRRERFDFVIVDFVFFLKCLYLVPYNLSVPFASIGSRIPRLDTGHPVTDNFAPYSSSLIETTFNERVINLVYHFFSRLLVGYFVSRIDISNLAPGLSWNDLENLHKMSDVFIESTDVVLDFPEVVMPNLIRVGCLTFKSANPLPVVINDFFDAANNGVVVISFGSKYQPNSHIHPLFLSVFRTLKQRVFWKCDQGKQSENILMYSQLSENDALVHRNTKLFIYPCGRKGMFESVYNGVPILCVPHTAEQFETARRIVQFKIGRFLQIHQLEEDYIRNSIVQILEEPEYSTNVKALSKILRSRRETPAQQAATAVEHVIRFGAKHFRSSHVGQSAFQLLNGDVWLAVFVLFTLAFVCVLLAFWKCCFFVIRIKNKFKVD